MSSLLAVAAAAAQLQEAHGVPAAAVAVGIGHQ
jgi:hypothetical protein